MNTFVYLKSKKELWLDSPEPIKTDYDFYKHHKKWDEYNSRLHYTVSDELGALLVEGEKKKENGFAIGWTSDNVNILKSKDDIPFDAEQYFHPIAIPLPDKSKEVEVVQMAKLTIIDALMEWVNKSDKMSIHRKEFFDLAKFIGSKLEPEPTTVKQDGLDYPMSIVIWNNAREMTQEEFSKWYTSK